MTIQVKHFVVLLALVALIAMLVMAGANVEYLSIAAERSSVAASVNSGNIDFQALETNYQRCIDRMNALEEQSDYGYFLASIDKMTAGKLVIGILMLGQMAIVAIAAFMIGAYVVFTTMKQIRRIKKAIRRAKARKNRTAKKKVVQQRPRRVA